jgi:hypothetical protein
MRPIDDRGRLFGRINIIDATIVAFLLVLLPIVYTASRLFRVPKPEFERVEPATQVVGPDVRIRVHGRNFRPLLKALTNQTGQPFSVIDPSSLSHTGSILLEGSSEIEVKLPELTAGSYDLHIFDATQEVARQERSFTLTSPPRPPSPSVPSGLVHARVRFVVSPELRRLVREGDVETSAPGDQEGVPPVAASLPATLTRISSINDRLPPSVDFGDGWGAGLIEAEVSLPARQNAKGEWEHRGVILRVGERIFFRTVTYSMQGTVGEVRLTPLPAGGVSK